MPALLYNIAGTVVFHIIQLIAGCLLAFFVYRASRGKVSTAKKSFTTETFIVALCSLAGLVLPLGIYGIVPVIAALLAVGFKGHAAGALLVSNVMFNMLVPFNDPSFIWKTGIRQIVFAFIAGLAAGMILITVKNSGKILFSQKYMPSIRTNLSIPGAIFHLMDDCIKKLGLFLVIGVIADIIFMRFVLGRLIGLFYISSFTSSIPAFFGTHDVSNPFFLLTFSIVYMLMNLVNLSALLAILKKRGMAVYMGYYMLWAMILAISAFI